MANSSALDVRPVAAWACAWARLRPNSQITVPSALRFALAAAPACWLLQIVLAHAAAPILCRDSLWAASVVRSAIYGSDALALAGAFSGGLVAFSSWRGLRPQTCDGLQVERSRLRLLAMWSMMESLWLFGAIVFNAIGSMPGAACGS